MITISVIVVLVSPLPITASEAGIILLYAIQLLDEFQYTGTPPLSRHTLATETGPNSWP